MNTNVAALLTKERPDLRMQGLVAVERIAAGGGQTVSGKISVICMQ